MIPLAKKVILLGCLLLLTACVKNNFNQQNTLVPHVNVNFHVNADFISLVGQFTIETGHGYQGIIVFNIDGNNTFRAFDLGCPYVKPSECNIPMQVDEATGEMSCAGCANDDIRFTQYKTGVTIGETQYYLREYNAYLEGGVVRITNF
ncbi:hypothetical protein AXE80_13865 [Wenyingzhuangia fucanilytica]|uniref:Rieske domain-containing protein n=1 Tax=Wenyingzhuangia fucanilytica TaxID=1790137 RepID=A0A1B1Y962_9FLAO|nr:hypothetical protein [Wenyingzhuangia fucanilytica]ANW97312.1 hypothetical protein AXE80_13865 [Wenyingzhuangia fucanilytica]